MSVEVKVKPEVSDLVFPDGRVYDSGQTVTLSDEAYAALPASIKRYLYTPDDPEPAPNTTKSPGGVRVIDGVLYDDSGNGIAVGGGDLPLSYDPDELLTSGLYSVLSDDLPGIYSGGRIAVFHASGSLSVYQILFHEDDQIYSRVGADNKGNFGWGEWAPLGGTPDRLASLATPTLDANDAKESGFYAVANGENPGENMPDAGFGALLVLGVDLPEYDLIVQVAISWAAMDRIWTRFGVVFSDGTPDSWYPWNEVGGGGDGGDTGWVERDTEFSDPDNPLGISYLAMRRVGNLVTAGGNGGLVGPAGTMIVQSNLIPEGFRPSNPLGEVTETAAKLLIYRPTGEVVVQFFEEQDDGRIPSISWFTDDPFP